MGRHDLFTLVSSLAAGRPTVLLDPPCSAFTVYGSQLGGMPGEASVSNFP
ncbi:MAG: hypothetical protein M1493_06025 [Firmicutes bacterium]|nr:hypothetical protein [Bacillota bacterium]